MKLNGDQVYIMKNKGESTILQLNKDFIGHCITTKKVGLNEKQDITLNYKLKSFSLKDKSKQNDVSDKRLELELDVKIELLNGKDYLKVDQSFDFKITVDTTNIKQLKNAFVKCCLIDFRANVLQHFYKKYVEFDKIPNSNLSQAVVKIPLEDMNQILNPNLPIAVVEAFIKYDDSLVHFETGQFEVEHHFNNLTSNQVEVDSSLVLKIIIPKFVKAHFINQFHIDFRNTSNQDMKHIKIEVTTLGEIDQKTKTYE